MPGRLLNIEEISATAFAGLDKDKTAVFIPISPIEGHGSHLPLGVDAFNAEYFARRAAEFTLQARGDFDAVLCPLIPLGSQLYRQPGSIRIRSRTIYRIIMEVGSSLAVAGCRYIFILSGHGAPRDIVAIESACHGVSRKFKIRMHNLSGSIAVRFLSGQLTERISSRLKTPLTQQESDLLKKDTHGGWWETSMMLLLRPRLVDDGFRSLPDTQKGAAGPSPAYYGSPSRASAEFARASLEVMMEDAGEIIKQCLSGRDVSRLTLSPLYRILPLRPFFGRNLLLGVVISVAAVVILLLYYLLLAR